MAPTAGFQQETLVSYLQHMTDAELALSYTEINAEGQAESVEQLGRGVKFPAADKVRASMSVAPNRIVNPSMTIILPCMHLRA